ncbi:MAG: HAD family hydrolase [Bacteroidaceae bacterium]|nr:HAD family hydrolase [Bacteroidaceae bacterium]
MTTLILDFDGTLGDSRKLIVKTMRQTLKAMQLPPCSEAQCAATIGLPLIKSFASLMPMNEKTAKACADLYSDVFFPQNNHPGSVPAFPHVINTIKQLHQQNVLLTIASSRRTSSLVTLLTEMDIIGYFRQIVSVLDVVHAKPAPDMALKILHDTGSLPENTLVIGDTSFDIQMGSSAGCRTCGVTYGNGTREQLQKAGAQFIIDDFQKTISLISL